MPGEVSMKREKGGERQSSINGRSWGKCSGQFRNEDVEFFNLVPTLDS